MPLLSIVVPTLNRPDTLRHALETLAAQDSADCEFIIQNNGGNAEIAALVEALRDPRFKHFTTPDIVTMTENWELALGHATGDYVTFIGDDDGLMPDACAIAEAVLKTGDVTLLSWAPYAYYWPGYYDAGYRNRLVAAVDFRFTGERVASREQLIRFYGFQAHYSRLPMIYNSFVRRDLIVRMREFAGRYFLGLSPDVTSGIVNAALSGDFLRLSRPLSISGLSRHSTGHTNFFEKTDSLGSPNGRRDFGTIEKDPALPDLNALPLFLANDMLQVQRRLFPDDPIIALNFKGLAQAVATDINDRPEIFIRTRQSIRDLLAMHRIDPAQIIIPARTERRPPLATGITQLGPNRVQFCLDGDALGLRSIADAVRVMAQLVPGAGALNPAALPRYVAEPIVRRQGLDFTLGGPGVAGLVEGWSEPEAWGTWSVAKTCSLRIKLTERPHLPVKIELDCRAFIPAENPQLQVRCCVGSMAPQDWTFSAMSPGGPRAFRINPGAIDGNNMVTIAFILTDPRSPADLGLSADVRPLGIGIERMRIVG